MPTNEDSIVDSAAGRMGDAFLTSHSLLGRLRQCPHDQEAWSMFADRYGKLIRIWCRQWHLQNADIEDVTQNVLLEISRGMQLTQYRNEGRFRYWLKTIAYRAWCDYLKRQQRPGGGSGDSVIVRLLNNAQARDDLLKQLDDECRRELLDAAMHEVQSRVQSHTFESWRLMSFEGRSGEEVAASLGINIGSVFVAKSRVDRLMTEVVKRLDREPESSD